MPTNLPPRAPIGPEPLWITAMGVPRHEAAPGVGNAGVSEGESGAAGSVARQAIETQKLNSSDNCFHRQIQSQSAFGESLEAILHVERHSLAIDSMNQNGRSADVRGHGRRTEKCIF